MPTRNMFPLECSIYIREHKNKPQHECQSQLSNWDEHNINTTNLLSKKITINDHMNTAICNAHIVSIRYVLNRRGSEKRTMNLKNWKAPIKDLKDLANCYNILWPSFWNICAARFVVLLLWVYFISGMFIYYVFIINLGSIQTGSIYSQQQI